MIQRSIDVMIAVDVVNILRQTIAEFENIGPLLSTSQRIHDDDLSVDFVGTEI